MSWNGALPTTPLLQSFLSSSRSESYWTAVVGEFDITKKDPDEQVLKVNRIIPHPKVQRINSPYIIMNNKFSHQNPVIN